MSWEISWSPEIEEDFLENNFSDEEIIKANEKIELASQFPRRLEKVVGVSNKYDIRKVRHRFFRIFSAS